MPSWTDRVLWRSMPAHAERLRLVEYVGCEAVGSSDHKPVRATFELKLSPPPPPPPPRECVSRLRWPSASASKMLKAPARGARPSAWGGSLDPVRVRFTQLAADGLTAMDWAIDGGKSDPYVKFVAEPPGCAWLGFEAPATSAWAAGEVGDVAVPRTSVLKNTLDPRWPADEAITLELPPRGHGLHRGLHCALVCVDYDVHSADDVIGSCALPLGRWLLDAGAPLAGKGSGAWHEFDEVLLHNGREHGRLRGAVEIVPSVFGGTSK